MNKLNPKTVSQRRRKIRDTISGLERQIRELLERCSHEGTVYYYPDPSGSSDSGYECSVCGRCWKRWPEDVPRQN